MDAIYVPCVHHLSFPKMLTSLRKTHEKSCLEKSPLLHPPRQQSSRERCEFDAQWKIVPVSSDAAGSSRSAASL
ncbi:hypothetical protein BDR03DRAFT_973963 [Suillus americanus]|nr:hypothetical protein BDR03DRAFT_973963 [Suillus americanus]